MIADLDETIRQLLIEELPVKNGEIEISFEQPKREWSSRLSKPAVNLFLYDIRENNVLRSHQWERFSGGNSEGRAQLKRTSLRADCSYLLTTWAADPEDEHRLLTRCLLALYRFPVLPEPRLVGSLQHPPYDIQARVAQHDVLTDPSDLWSVLDNELRPSLSYIITLALDPWQPVTTPIVHTRILRFGQAEGLPDEPYLAPNSAQVDLVVIGGSVRDGETGAPQGGVAVALKDTGYVATTDTEGHFILGSVAPGGYTLIVWPLDKKPLQKKVQVPADSGDYDIEV